MSGTELAHGGAQTLKFKLTIKAGKGGKGKKSSTAAQAAASVKEEEEEERVEVQHAGDWWQAVVQKRSEGSVLIRYEGGVAEDDEWIEESSSRIRAPQPEPVHVWQELEH
eukprot:631985-Rhodomonas_salina.1